MGQLPAIIKGELLRMRSFSPKSEVQVIDNLLANELVCFEAFEKIIELNPHESEIEDGPQRWQLFVDVFVGMAAQFAPEKTKDIRAAAYRVNEITREIREKSHALANLMRARGDLCNQFGLTRPLDYHPVDVLDEAAVIGQTAGAYRLDIAETLHSLSNRYPYRHWPTTADFMEAVGSLQEDAGYPENDEIAAAMASPKSSIRDFWRALDVCLDSLAERDGVDTRLPYAAFVDLTNAALNLNPQVQVGNYSAYATDQAKLSGENNLLNSNS